MNALRHVLYALVVVALSACASPPAPTYDAARAPVILVSIDGFRADYLSEENTPTLWRLAQEGAHGALRPSFPSVTFPNHYALITGRRPDRNGMINNRMEDPERPGVVFTLGDRAVAADPIWWADATPLWITAERAGIRTGTMFWPGSDFELQGMRPSQWRTFDMGMPNTARVETLLSWLDLPTSARPVFFTLYFDTVDTAGHRFGPDAPETIDAVREVDARIAQLIEGLAARGVVANLVIVADHGMASVSDERIIDLDANAGAEVAHVVWDGPFAGLTPAPGHEAEVEASLLGRSEHGECWRRGELPERFHYGTHRRMPAIICLADMGWRYRSGQIRQYAGQTLGAHGYDPAAPEMAAIFIANGPAFRLGVTLPAFDNVSVYPMLAQLIGVAPEAHDGDLADTAPALN
jgi:predicted AlkP superfamily pyrophosphatase or phosphodiesterase